MGQSIFWSYQKKKCIVMSVLNPTLINYSYNICFELCSQTNVCRNLWLRVKPSWHTEWKWQLDVNHSPALKTDFPAFWQEGKSHKSADQLNINGGNMCIVSTYYIRWFSCPFKDLLIAVRSAHYSVCAGHPSHQRGMCVKHVGSTSPPVAR